MSKPYKIPLSPDQLMAKARDITNINIIDEKAIEPLRVLVNSLNEESQLHEMGAARIQVKLLRMLANRLRMIRDFSAHPEINEQEIIKPIFVSGSLRTGSTKTQRLFTESDDFNWLPLWKTLNSASYTGHPNEDVAPRIADAAEYLKDLYEGSPFAAATHEQGVDIAEEESYIFMQCLHSNGYMGVANVPSYIQWLSKQDMSHAYQYLKDTLKYLQWQGLADPGKRWLLKSPWHCGMESTLTSIFPDASLIVTHRSPAEFVASMCSMLSSYIESHTSNTEIDGHQVVHGLAISLENHLNFRKKYPEFPIHDIYYKEVTTSVKEVVQRVYDFLNIPLKDESLKRVIDWDSNNPIHKHGSHKYSPEDFGLTKSEIESSCKQYMDFLREKSYL